MNEPVSLRTIFRWAVVASLGVFLVSLGVLAVYTVRGILVLAIIALFIAVSLDPAVRWLVRHGVRRSWAVALIFVIAFLAVGGLLAAVIPPLVREGAALSDDLPRYIDQLTERSRRLREFGDRFGLTDRLRELAADLPAEIGANVLGFVRSFFGAVFTTLTVTVLTIYFMANLPKLQEGVVRLFPGPARRHIRRTVDVTVDKVGAYMIGNILISLAAGVSTFIVLTVLGAPFALPLAVVVAITDLIPMIGATLGAVVCVGVTALSSDLWPTTVLVAIFFVVYQQLENYLIAPRILRNTVDIPALAVLLAALIGGTVLGLVGALMAIPIAAVVKVLMSPKIREMDAAEPPMEEAPAPVTGVETPPGQV
jgi:predicted PurR-regulated permease PerM